MYFSAKSLKSWWHNIWTKLLMSLSFFYVENLKCRTLKSWKGHHFFFIQHYTYYSLLSSTSECAKCTFEWLFRHYYSKIISDFFVSQKHRKFRIVLRGNLIKHKPALHNSLISEEWCADAIVISKINQSTTNWKQTNLNFSHILLLLMYLQQIQNFFPSYSCFNASTN